MDSNPKHQVLIIYPNQFGYHTDSYKYCEHLQDSFDISYLCFDQGFERLSLPDVNVFYIPYNTGKVRRLIHFFNFLTHLTRKVKFDILFTIQFKFCFIIGLFAKSKVKILDYRTGDLDNNERKRNLKNLFLRFDSIFFKNISAISEGLRDILKLNKVKTHILPLGADKISDHIRSFSRFDLLYVGTFNSRNIHQTIEGVALFLSEYKELSTLVSYTIIGFGSDNDVEKINNTIEELGLNNTVHFLGRKKYTDIAEYFDTCNIGVSYVPMTPYFEYQPVTKLFEYLLSGMPVIATNTHENRLIVNNTNGVLINDTPEDFCNGLKNIYNQRLTYNSSEIRKSVEAYTWQNIVDTNLRPYLLGLIKST
jgi:glycosyltransferase involved in cell wall biosynthesis